MELVELLPTQGSIRIGPVQVKPGGAVRRPAPEHRHDVRPPRQAGVVRPSDRAERPPLVAAAGPVTTRSTGRQPPVATLPAGETLQVDLLWRSLQDHPGVFIVNVTLDDDQGFRWATREVEPVDRMYPSWMWSADEVIRDQIRLEIPPEVPPGRYQLNVKLFDRGRPLPTLDAQAAASRDPGEADRRRHPAHREPAPRARRDDRRAQAPEADRRSGDRRQQPRRRRADRRRVAGPGAGLAGAPRRPEGVRRPHPDRRQRRQELGRADRAAGRAANPTSNWERNDIFRASTACRSTARPVPARGGWWWSSASAASSVRPAELRSAR